MRAGGGVLWAFAGADGLRGEPHGVLLVCIEEAGSVEQRAESEERRARNGEWQEEVTKVGKHEERSVGVME